MEEMTDMEVDLGTLGLSSMRYGSYQECIDAMYGDPSGRCEMAVVKSYMDTENYRTGHYMDARRWKAVH